MDTYIVFFTHTTTGESLWVCEPPSKIRPAQTHDLATARTAAQVYNDARPDWGKDFHVQRLTGIDMTSNGMTIRCERVLPEEGD